MQDLRQQVEGLRQQAKEEMDKPEQDREGYFTASGKHAAYKNMVKILEEREQEIEETYYE